MVKVQNVNLLVLEPLAFASALLAKHAIYLHVAIFRLLNVSFLPYLIQYHEQRCGNTAVRCIKKPKSKLLIQDLSIRTNSILIWHPAEIIYSVKVLKMKLDFKVWYQINQTGISV